MVAGEGAAEVGEWVGESGDGGGGGGRRAAWRREAYREEAELLEGQADGWVLGADGLLKEHQQLAPLLPHRPRQRGLALGADEAQDARGERWRRDERDEEVIDALGDRVQQRAPASGALGRLRPLATSLQQLQRHLEGGHVDRGARLAEAARHQPLAVLAPLHRRLVQARRQRLRRGEQRAEQLRAVLRRLGVLARHIAQQRGHEHRVRDPRAARVWLRRLRRHAGLQGGRLAHAEGEQHLHDCVRANVQQQAGHDLRQAAARQCDRVRAKGAK